MQSARSIEDDVKAEAMTMSSTPTLPAEAIAALRQGQKIAAIKIVRERQNLDLAAAKAAVDAAIVADPWLRKQCDAAARRGSGGRILTWVLAIIAAVVAWYKFAWQF